MVDEHRPSYKLIKGCILKSRIQAHRGTKLLLVCCVLMVRICDVDVCCCYCWSKEHEATGSSRRGTVVVVASRAAAVAPQFVIDALGCCTSVRVVAQTGS